MGQKNKIEKQDQKTNIIGGKYLQFISQKCFSLIFKEILNIDKKKRAGRGGSRL